MRGFKALIALGHVLCEERGPEAARAAFDVVQSVFFAGINPPTSRNEQHQEIYRRWTKGTLPETWIPVAESVLLHHPPSWLDYVASLNDGDLPAAERLGLLLAVRKRRGFSPGPEFDALAQKLRDEADGQETNAVFPFADPAFVEIVTPAETAVAETTKPPVGEFFTQSQAEARQRILALGRLYFSDTNAGGAIRPRTSPLIVAATGSGKTSLVGSVAKELDAHLLRLTVSEWIPIGANRDLIPSLMEITEALATHPRLLVLIDELDKFTDDGRSWSRSSATEVLNVLERSLPESVFSLMRKSGDKRPLIEQRLKSGLFVTGAGAWQSLHQNRPKSVGFHGTCITETSGDLLLRAIRDSGFPSELLGRFHASPIPLPYPSVAETKEIFDRLGIHSLATRLGMEDRLRGFSWAPFGFRTLESLWADLLIAEQTLRLSHGPCVTSGERSNDAAS
jgi:hypothetical protein